MAYNWKQVMKEICKELNNNISKVNFNLNEKVNKKDELMYESNNLYLASFFVGSNVGDILSETLFWYITSDGKNFTRLNNKSNLFARDTSFIFHENKCYLLRTKREWDTPYEFDLLISDNLIDWELKKINVGTATTTYNTTWSPDWFIDDNGSVYIIYSQNVGAEFKDEENITRHDNRQYIVEVKDLDNLIFGEPRKLNLEGEYARIDGNIVKKDNKYYLFVKRDATQDGIPSDTIEIFSSNDLVTWAMEKQIIDSLSGWHFEAPQVCKINNLYYLYIDNKPQTTKTKNENGGMYFCTSTDLINWSEPKKIQTKMELRHGCVREIKSTISKKMVNNVLTNSVLNKTFDPQNYYNNSIVTMEYNSLEIKPYIKLFDINLDNYKKVTYIDFKITDNINNQFNSECSITINKINDTTFNVEFKETETNKTSMSEKLFLIKTNNNIFTLFLKANDFTSALLPVIYIKSINSRYETITAYTNTTVDT